MTDSDPQVLTAGEALPRPFGPYTLLRELGRGAMGVVYEALHRDLGWTAAVKILRIDFDTEPEWRERFRREARACAQVHHGHIIQIYEAGEVDGRPYYAMELVPGKSLAALLKDGEMPPPADLMRGLSGVADALHALHGAGIVHRDVKPSNVIVRPDGRMLLADFGLAHIAAAKTLSHTGEMLGTPLYMSPEQILGEKGEVDARTDVYGFGATLYEALSGRAAYSSDSIQALFAMILSESVRPAPLRSLSSEVPEACERIALKALEKRKEDRYQSAAALRDDLLAFSAGEPVAGRPVSKPVRTIRSVRRHPVVVGAAALAVAAALWYVLRPAQVSISTFPSGAEVLIDGGTKGSTPASLSLAAGAHELTLRRAHFLDFVKRDDFKSGPNRLDLPLSPSDDEGFHLLMQSMGIAVTSFVKPEGSRAETEGSPVELLMPRDRVRLADLTTLAVDIDAERVSSSGVLEFRIGARSLGSLPFPTTTPFEAAVPDEVRAALHAGDTVTWGWWPEGGKPVTTTFSVVEAVPSPALDAAQKRLASLPGHLAEHATVSFLLDQRLFNAAFLKARATSQSDKRDVRALAEMRAALAGLGLEDSRAAGAIRSQIRAQPPAELERVFGP